jgi:hypothetical protein
MDSVVIHLTDLKPVTVDIQKTSRSYIVNQEQIENGK